jgi:hypothetical protein
MFLSLISVYLLLAMLYQENATADFADLGKLMVAGLGVSIIIAVSFTIIRFRLRDKKPQTDNFISINSFRQED